MVFYLSKKFVLMSLFVSCVMIGSEGAAKRHRVIPLTIENKNHIALNAFTSFYYSGDEEVYTVFLTYKDQTKIIKNSYFQEPIKSLAWNSDLELSVLFESGALQTIKVQKKKESYCTIYY